MASGYVVEQDVEVPMRDGTILRAGDLVTTPGGAAAAKAALPAGALKLAQARLCESCHVSNAAVAGRSHLGAKFVASFDRPELVLSAGRKAGTGRKRVLELASARREGRPINRSRHCPGTPTRPRGSSAAQTVVDRHADASVGDRCHGDAAGAGFAAHVHHVGLALGVEMGQDIGRGSHGCAW